jgi:DNA topoisomerase-1
MRFMAWTSLRAGSQESLSTTGVEVQSFGASSLLQKHVQINGSQVTLEFTSKAGVAAKFEYDNQELATMLYDRMKKGGFRPTQQLYQVTDDQVARYMKLTMNKTLGLEEKNYSPKDFRTLGARSMTLQAIGEMDAPKNRQEFNKARKAVAVAVSKGLGNDVDTALASYIDPMLFEEWENELEDSDDE